jgi:hypothetical protein
MGILMGIVIGYSIDDHEPLPPIQKYPYDYQMNVIQDDSTNLLYTVFRNDTLVGMVPAEKLDSVIIKDNE